MVVPEFPTSRRLSGSLSASMPFPGRPFHSTVAGDESIAKRPMKRVTEPLKQMGAAIDGRADGGFTPLSVRGGQLKGIDYVSPVASAQIKSAVLLAGLQAEGTTTVTEPHKSRDHTERMLNAFGAELAETETSASVTGGQKHQSFPCVSDSGRHFSAQSGFRERQRPRRGKRPLKKYRRARKYQLPEASDRPLRKRSSPFPQARRQKSRDHTERMLNAFGAELAETETSASVTGGQKLRGADIFVPGDISSAAFFLALRAVRF